MNIYKYILYILLGILIASCEKQTTKPENSTLNLEVFEAAWERIDQVYPFFEFKKINWDSIYTVYLPRTEEAQGIEFHSVLHDMLAELKDGHVYYKSLLSSAVIPWPTPRQIRDQNVFSLSVVSTYFNRNLQITVQETIQYEILPDNIGYVAITNFNHEDFAQEWPDALEYMKNTQSLIIDNRPNTGGSIQNVEVLIAQFITTSMAWPQLYFLGEEHPLSPLHPSGSYTYTKPVIVLINGCTFSAGESSTEILKQLPNITVVGDTTGGGGGVGSNHSTQTISNFFLPSGLLINIPTGYFLRYDGKHFEWLGVPPDIRVEQTEEDIQSGRDKQLEYAIDLLK